MANALTAVPDKVTLHCGGMTKVRIKTSPPTAGAEVSALGYDGVVVTVNPDKGTTDANGCLDVNISCGARGAGCPGSTVVSFDSPAFAAASVTATCQDYTSRLDTVAQAVRALESVLWFLSTGVVELLDDTLVERGRARELLEKQWGRLDGLGRAALIENVASHADHGLRGLVLASVKGSPGLQPLAVEVQPGHFSVGVDGLLVAAGIVAVWSAPEWGRLEVGLGVSPAEGDASVDVHTVVGHAHVPLGAVWVSYLEPSATAPTPQPGKSHGARRHTKGSDELAQAVLPLLATIGARAVDLVGATRRGRAAFARRIVPAWADADTDGRLRLYDDLRSALGIDMHAQFADWLALRAGALGAAATFHTDVTIKPAKQEVGVDKTAYGGKVVVDGDPPRVEVGAGVIPNPPKAQDVIDHPAGEILNKDRIEGGGFWVKFNY